MKQFRASSCALAIVLSWCVAVAPAVAAPAGRTVISGRVLDAQSGLPISGASVELDREQQKIAVVQTATDGTFRFAPQPPGTYSFGIDAPGYQRSRAPALSVNGQPSVSFQLAANRQVGGMKTIGYVATAGRTSLQTTTTINTHVDTAQLTGQNFQRLGDLLTTVPGVTTSTSSSVGDDMTLSIRGFDPTETATLLDGHPIGPLGAFGKGYNYNVSPFWGLGAADVVFGSGATGLFGATTIAGAVNFQTVNPTVKPVLSVTQGVGETDKLMTGILATGSFGKLGYATAWGVQGTTGNFPGGVITQTALLQTSAVHPGYKSNNPPPDITNANVNAGVNTYWVSGQYSQTNFVQKLAYEFSPRTTLQLTAYAANTWSNSTGNGDNDYQTYDYVLFGAQQEIATIQSQDHGVNTILVNGKPRSCRNTIAVLTNAPSGYSCFNAQQYASAFYGPFGGSVDRWRTLGNQDYDARLSQQVGIGTLTIEGFLDSYNYNEQKGPGAPLGQYTTYGPGPNYLYLFRNRGYMIGDDIPMGKHDLGFGFTWLHQANTNGQFPYTLPNGNSYNVFGTNPPLYMGTTSYYARDSWTPNDKLQLFGTFWLQNSLDTHATTLNPRVTAMYRPTNNDVIRLSGGSSYSEPDPGLLTLAPPVYSAPSSINCPSTTTGSGSLTAIASEADPNLQPERAGDLELAYGHRFSSTINLQADLYQSWEHQALLAGNVPIGQIPQVTVPENLIAQYLARLNSCPGLRPTVDNLAFSTTFNAASARYRGIVLGGTVGLARGLSLNANYTISSAAYLGIPQDILMANTGLLEGGQIHGIPLRQGTTSLAYTSPQGWSARLDGTYIGANNSYNRGPFWFANANASYNLPHATINVGIYNLFNSAAQQYGLIGAGTFEDQNFYGSAAMGGPTSALAQGSEQYGLPFRRLWMTLTTRL